MTFPFLRTPYWMTRARKWEEATFTRKGSIITHLGLWKRLQANSSEFAKEVAVNLFKLWRYVSVQTIACLVLDCRSRYHHKRAMQCSQKILKMEGLTVVENYDKSLRLLLWTKAIWFLTTVKAYITIGYAIKLHTKKLKKIKKYFLIGLSLRHALAASFHFPSK